MSMPPFLFWRDKGKSFKDTLVQYIGLTFKKNLVLYSRKHPNKYSEDYGEPDFGQKGQKRINRATDFSNTLCHFTQETAIKLTLLHIAELFGSVFHLKRNEKVPVVTD